MTKPVPIPEGIEFGKLTTFQGLSVLPVDQTSPQEAIEYLTLDEALTNAQVHITELNEGGNVPELLLDNGAEKPVLLVDGEELVGAKQNRTLNLTILAPANQKTVIPVSCVEAGRWAYTSDEFSHSNRAHFARGRAQKMASVSESMASAGSRRSNQGQVWADIDMKLSRMEMASDTSAMADMYQASETSLQAYVDAFDTSTNQVGAFFYLNQELVGFDIFDKPETFSRLFGKLLRSYAIEAVEEAVTDETSPGTTKAESLLTALRTAAWRNYPATGLGLDYRFQSPRLTAASLVVEKVVIHASGFLIPEGQSGHGDSGMASLHRRRRLRMH